MIHFDIICIWTLNSVATSKNLQIQMTFAKKICKTKKSYARKKNILISKTYIYIFKAINSNELSLSIHNHLTIKITQSLISFYRRNFLDLEIKLQILNIKSKPLLHALISRILQEYLPKLFVHRIKGIGHII